MTPHQTWVILEKKFAVEIFVSWKIWVVTVGHLQSYASPLARKMTEYSI
jgi:hypothetical protein